MFILDTTTGTTTGTTSETTTGTTSETTTGITTDTTTGTPILSHLAKICTNSGTGKKLKNREKRRKTEKTG